MWPSAVLSVSGLCRGLLVSLCFQCAEGGEWWCSWQEVKLLESKRHQWSPDNTIYHGSGCKKPSILSDVRAEIIFNINYWWCREIETIKHLSRCQPLMFEPSQRQTSRDVSKQVWRNSNAGQWIQTCNAASDVFKGLRFFSGGFQFHFGSQTGATLGCSHNISI